MKRTLQLFLLFAAVTSGVHAQCLTADLQLGAVTVYNDRTIPPGGWTAIEFQVHNRGIRVAGSFDVAVYLTATRSFPNLSDPALYRRTISSLGANQSTTSAGVGYVPHDFIPGTYYVWAIIDPDRRVSECDETNNNEASSVPLLTVDVQSSDDHPNHPSRVRDPQDVLTPQRTTAEGEIEAPRDVDVFRLDVRAGDSYDLQTQLVTLEDTYLELLDSDGTTVLAWNNDPSTGTPAARLNFIARKTPLYARVLGAYGDIAGSYRLVLTSISDDHPNAALDTVAPRDELSEQAPSLDGVIELSGDVDYFRIPVTPGRSYSISTVLGGLSDSVLTIVGPDGVTQIGQNDDFGGTRASRVDFTAPALTGLVYARVNGYGSARGGYSIQLVASGDDHPDSLRDVRDPQDLIDDERPSATGRIDPQGDLDFFRLDLAPGVSYVLEVGLAGLSDSVLTVFNPLGLVVAENDDLPGGGRASRVSLTGPASGSLFARVRGYGTATGGYTVALRRSDDHPDSAEATRSPQDVLSSTVPQMNASIDFGGDVDFYRIEVVAGNIYKLTCELEGLADSVLTVYNGSDLSVVVENDDRGSGDRGSRVVFTALSSGVLFARVKAFSLTQTGGYRLDLEQELPDDHPDRIAELDDTRDYLSVTLREQSARIDRPSDVDFFTPFVEAGRRYRISVELDGLSGARVGVFTLQGQLIGVNADAGPSQASNVDFTVPGSGGMVYLAAGVESVPPDAVGRYRIRLIPLQDLTTGDDHPGSAQDARFPEDALGDTLPEGSGSIQPFGDVDFFLLRARAGGRYAVDVRLVGLSSVEATVLDSSAVNVLGQSAAIVDLIGGGRGVSVPFTGPDNGMAVLRLRSLSGTGQYTVALRKLDDRPDDPARVTAADLIGVIGQPVPGAIETADDADLFAVRLTAGRAYRIEVDPIGAGRVRAELLDTDGTTVLAQSGSPSAGASAVMANLTVGTSGVRAIRVRSLDGQRTAYVVRLLLPRPEMRVWAETSSERVTATITVSGLPGPLSALLSFVVHDVESFDANLPVDGTIGGIKHAAVAPFPGLALLLARPEIVSNAGSGNQTAVVGRIEYRKKTGADGDPVGRIAPVASVIVSDNDVFVVAAPVADAGISRVLEAFDAENRLLPRIPDLPPNQARLGGFVRLDGTLSRDLNLDPRPLVYGWTVLKSPGPVTLAAPASATPSFVPPAPGEYIFSLVTTDGSLASLRDQVRVLVNRVGETPSAIARAARAGTITSSTPASELVTVAIDAGAVELDGTLSSSPVPGRSAQLSHSWRRVEGPPVTLTPSGLVSRPSFVPTTVGLHGFELMVSDPQGSVSPPTRIDVLVVPPGSVPPVLSVSARANTTADLGASSDRVGRAGSLRVTIPTTVALQASVIDSEVDAGRHTLLYTYRQISGPSVTLDRAFENTSSLASRASFAPEKPGVLEFEVRVQEVREGKPTDIAVRRTIRVIVDSATQKVPTARASVRGGAGKMPVTWSASEPTRITVPAGTSVQLDARGSSGTAGEVLRYAWEQVSGPQAVLSNPFSVVTTFVAPQVSASAMQPMQFNVYTDDGVTRSEPARIVVDVVPSELPRFDMPLRHGWNLVGLPVLPRVFGGSYTLASLLDSTGADAVSWLDGATFRTVQPGDPLAALVNVQGNQGYLLARAGSGQPPRMVSLAGDPWTEASLQREIRPGLNLVQLPLGVPAGYKLSSLLTLTGASWGVVLEQAGSRTRYRIHGAGLGTPDVDLTDGQAVLLCYPGASPRTVTLPRR